MLDDKVVVWGASLEDAATINFAPTNIVPAPDSRASIRCVWGMVLIDTRAFMDCIVPVLFLSKPANTDIAARLNQRTVLL